MKHRRIRFNTATPFVVALTLVAAASAATLKPGDFYTSGPRNEKKIALSFDDGPGPRTGEFLELLKKENIKATFFVQGTQVERRPDVLRRIKEGGHEIGSHTWQHLNYKTHLKKLQKKDAATAEQKASADLLEDMNKTRALIEDVIGQKIRLLRMPHGIDGAWIHAVAKKAGFILVNWTHGSDWSSEPLDKLIPGYKAAVKPGAIILLHDGWPKTDKSLEITKELIRHAKENGYQMVTVGELLES